MKRLAKWLAPLLALVAVGASSPLVQIDSVTSLLQRPPTKNEVLLVLGFSSAFDGQMYVAKHFTNIAYPIDYVNTFPALNIGEWYLTALGTSVSGGFTNAMSVMSSDGTSHAVSVFIDPITLGYSFQVDSTPGSATRGLVVMCPDDYSFHIVMAEKVGTNYTLTVEQSATTSVPSYAPVLIAADASLHAFSLLKVGTNYLPCLFQ